MDNYLTLPVYQSIVETVDYLNNLHENHCIDLRFELKVVSRNQTDRDFEILISRAPRFWDAGPSGIAEFPSGGYPGRTIEVTPKTDRLDPDTRRHVIMHEIFHTIGFRHSDYFDRSLSCGGLPFNEDDIPLSIIIGSNHVPGSPTGFDVTSLMNSCFDGVNGECGYLSMSDYFAYQTMYGHPERPQGNSPFRIPCQPKGLCSSITSIDLSLTLCPNFPFCF